MRSTFSFLFALVACSGEGTTAQSGAGVDSCVGALAECVCNAGGTVGRNGCGQQCDCPGFVDAGRVVAPPAVSTPPVTNGAPLGPTGADCEPGLYKGTYDCTIDLGDGPVPLMGNVQFELEVSKKEPDPSCEEFCETLAIAEGKGSLFGLVFELVGFRTDLAGGLDCRTGEFRATAENGVYGIPIPEDLGDLEGQWSVLDPPVGTFEGFLQGMHDAARPQTISGTWGLADVGSGVECSGPFTATHTP